MKILQFNRWLISGKQHDHRSGLLPSASPWCWWLLALVLSVGLIPSVLTRRLAAAVIQVSNRADLGPTMRESWFWSLSPEDVFEGAMIPDPARGITPLGFRFRMTGGGDAAFQLGTAGRRGFVNDFYPAQSLISSFGKTLIVLDFLDGTVSRFGVEVSAREPGPFVAFMEVWGKDITSFDYLTAPGVSGSGPGGLAFLGFVAFPERIERIVLGLESAMNDVTWNFWISEPSMSAEATPEPSSMFVWCLLIALVGWCRIARRQRTKRSRSRSERPFD
ncbi:MAG: hypothetical protein ACKOU6_11090 [Planctomycetota bacterium]